MHPKHVKLTQTAWRSKLAHLAKLMLLLMVILSVTACQPVRALPNNESSSADSGLTSREQANKAVVQRWYEEVFNQQNPSVIGDIFAENAVVHDLDYGQDGGGPDLPFVSFPDLQATVDLWIVKDDYVTAVVTLTGTHQGEFLGVSPTGKQVTWSLIDIWRVEDGKAAELWHNVPNNDILEQLGYTLSPATK